jgi:hypothetical protein
LWYFHLESKFNVTELDRTIVSQLAIVTIVMPV